MTCTKHISTSFRNFEIECEKTQLVSMICHNLMATLTLNDGSIAALALDNIVNLKYPC
jgi:hypothetical protein